MHARQPKSLTELVAISKEEWKDLELATKSVYKPRYFPKGVLLCVLTMQSAQTLLQALYFFVILTVNGKKLK